MKALSLSGLSEMVDWVEENLPPVVWLLLLIPFMLMILLMTLLLPHRIWKHWWSFE